jgi:hypothetical protein
MEDRSALYMSWQELGVRTYEDLGLAAVDRYVEAKARSAAGAWAGASC